MKARVLSSYYGEVYVGWTKRLADSLMEQLDNPKVYKSRLHLTDSESSPGLGR